METQKTRAKHKLKKKKLSVLGRSVTYIYLLLLYFPIYWMFTMAFKRRVDITVSPPKFVFTPVLENFVDVFRRSDVLSSLSQSLWVSTLSVGLASILGSMAAYALARFKWFRQKDIELFIVSTRMLPPVAVIIPFYTLFIRFRLLDSGVALAFVYLLISLPLVIWLMLGFFRMVPKELSEAAAIEGCSVTKTFFLIELPIVKSGLATSAMLAFLFTWGELFFAFILMSFNRTFPVALLSFLAVGLEVKYGPMAAAGVIAIIPSIIVAIIGRRALVTGFQSLAGVH